MAGLSLITGIDGIETGLTFDLATAILFDQSNREDRNSSGQNGAYTKARSEMKRILENHQPNHLSDSIEAELKSIPAIEYSYYFKIV